MADSEKPTPKKPTKRRKVAPEIKAKKTPVAEPNVAPESPAAPVMHMMAEQKFSPRARRWVMILFIVTVGITGLLGAAYAGVVAYYNDKAYPGVHFGNTDVGGKTADQIEGILTTYQTSLEKNGLQLNYEDTKLNIPVDTQDEATAIVALDIPQSITNAMAVGHSNTSWWNDLVERLSSLGVSQVDLSYTLNTEAVVDQLKTTYEPFATPAVNATLAFDEDHTIIITPETDGETFKWVDVLVEIETKLNHLEPVNVALPLTEEVAGVTESDIEQHSTEVLAVVALAPVTLTYEDDTFTVDDTTLEGWLTVTPSGVDLQPEVVTSYLQTIAADIDVPVQEGRFSLDITDGEVHLKQFADGHDGLGVHMEKSLAALNQALIVEGVSTSALVVEVTQPRATPDSLDNLGVKELLGTGETSFAGSPYNRVLNIKKGADMLNGLLIAPGETFSLLDSLKPIDTAHGWFSELVIKGDKLEKEAGGGLCQVGTTSFRAAMLSGLPIVERRNHSWAISYYAYKGKAGVDATIYDPSPDFRFLNDTGHYILWRSRIEGSALLFEFWGTSDGRKGSFTDPVNSNYTSAGPTVETIDPTLPPGTRTCDGHAFGGVTAAFDYIVEHLDGTVDTRTFTSVYKSRAAACVVGPEEITENTEAEAENAETTTNTNVNTNTNSNTNTANTNSNKNSNKNKNKKN